VIELSDESRRGRFVVLEGIDGSGTTTHTGILSKTLSRRGTAVCRTAEPTGGPVGSLIRQVLERRLTVQSARGPRPFAWSTMALLFAADRLDHLDSTIVPALRAGQTVVSDRYDLSSLAYQSLGAPDADAALGWIRQLNSRALRPDLVIVLDVPAAVAAARRRARGGREQLFEADDFQRRLADLYARAEQLLPGDRVVHVDADAEVEQVAARVAEAAGV
jgi:dTMP kinase